MEPFRHHLFVCTQEKPEGVTSCPCNGSWRVLAALEREVASQGLDNEVQLSTCGCLGLCEDGPIVITYPDGVYYHKVQESDVPEIVSSHLRDGKVVARLAWTDAAAMKAQSLEHRDRYRAMLKARDQAGILPDDLNELLRAYMPSRAMLTALELDIFTAVGDGSSVEQVAKKIHAAPRSTEMLLNVLTSLKLIEKHNGTFRNTPTSARFFSAASPDDARPGLLHIANIYHRWSTLTDAVLAGTTVATRSRDGRLVIDFIAAMDRNAKERAAAVVKAVSPGAIRRMLDLGGGSGAYSIAFARAVSRLHCEILDLGDVVPLAQKYIRDAGLAERITVREGDMLTAPFGENFDLVLVMAICHMFSPEENRKLFQRAHRALAPGGQIVIQDFVLEADKTAPRAAALFALNMLVGTRAGSTYSEPEYTAWLREAGFADVRRVRLPGPSSLMLATRP